jgi:hypothetical protein
MDIHNGCADEGIAIVGVRHEQAAALEQALVQRPPLQQLSQAVPESSLFDVEPERLSKVPGQLDFIAVMFFLAAAGRRAQTRACLPWKARPPASCRRGTASPIARRQSPRI